MCTFWESRQPFLRKDKSSYPGFVVPTSYTLTLFLLLSKIRPIFHGIIMKLDEIKTAPKKCCHHFENQTYTLLFNCPLRPVSRFDNVFHIEIAWLCMYVRRTVLMKVLFAVCCGLVTNPVSDKRPVWCVVVTRCHKLNRLQNKKCFVFFSLPLPCHQTLRQPFKSWLPHGLWLMIKYWMWLPAG